MSGNNSWANQYGKLTVKQVKKMNKEVSQGQKRSVSSWILIILFILAFAMTILVLEMLYI